MSNNLFFSNPQVVLQEVPDELSLAISISGCNLGCSGCHSSETWDKSYGSELTDTILRNLLTKHKHISCLLIYDGMHNVDRLTELLVIAKSFNLKTAMYTGLDVLEPELINLLDYYKLGKYNKQLGGLSSTTTNQRLYKVIQPSTIHQYNFQSKQWSIVHT